MNIDQMDLIMYQHGSMYKKIKSKKFMSNDASTGYFYFKIYYKTRVNMILF